MFRKITYYLLSLLLFVGVVFADDNGTFRIKNEMTHTDFVNISFRHHIKSVDLGPAGGDSYTSNYHYDFNDISAQSSKNIPAASNAEFQEFCGDNNWRRYNTLTFVFSTSDHQYCASVNNITMRKTNWDDTPTLLQINILSIDKMNVLIEKESGRTYYHHTIDISPC